MRRAEVLLGERVSRRERVRPPWGMGGILLVLVVELEEAGTKEGVKAERRSTRPEEEEGKVKCLRGVTLWWWG
jgi:hypothetical protein